MKRSFIRLLLWSAIALLCGLRFCSLTADFPNHSPWAADQAKFTDEGWWARAAITHHRTGQWTLPGDYNPAVAVPVWPLLLALLFHVTGISLTAARALNVAFSIGTVAAACCLVRRYARHTRRTAPMLSGLLLASSPIAFAFSRLAILDTLVAFEFSLLLLAASFANEKRTLSLILLAVLTTAMVLTKTTSVALLPAVAWLALLSMSFSIASCARVAFALGLLPGALLWAYRLLVIAKGHGADYSYFFSENASEAIAWNHALAWIGHTIRNGVWLGPVFYLAAAGAAILSVLRLRTLWSNPLFVAALIAIAGQAAYLFSRQDEEAPRYFLVLVVPIVLILVLWLDALKTHSRTVYRVAILLVCVAVVSNVASILSFMRHRTYAFYTAARSIQTIMDRESHRNRRLLGISAAQLSLVTGDPSLNDVFGTESLAAKVARYQPEWFISWNGIGDEQRAALAASRLEKMVSYNIFDNDDRDELILYHVEWDAGTGR